MTRILIALAILAAPNAAVAMPLPAPRSTGAACFVIHNHVVCVNFD